jgi:FXSXX-COOH protein
VQDPGDRPGEGTSGEALPRVGEVPLADLIPAGHSALANAVRRVVEATERSTDTFAAFGSAPLT